jgi:ketosteroid isomerase-like protein
VARQGGGDRATIDRAAAADWVARYERAWQSNDPAHIGALFTDDATYQVTPMADAWRGREAIVKGWLDRQDDPGTWTFESDVLACEDDLAVVRGVTRYKEPYPTYENLWLIRLDPDGRAREFIEFWMEHERPDADGAETPT